MTPVVALALALTGCGPKSSTGQNEAPPLSKAPVNEAAYHLKVQSDGTFTWNGQAVDRQTFKTYLRQFAAMPKVSGSLSVEFEPGTSTRVRDITRDDMVASGLCRQERCVEVSWGTPTRVVN